MQLLLRCIDDYTDSGVGTVAAMAAALLPVPKGKNFMPVIAAKFL